jgi:uncharacterized protein
MKKLILLSAILYISGSTLLFSQESKEDKVYKEKFIEFMNLNNTKETFITSTIGAIEQNIDNPQVPEEQKNLLKEFVARIKGISQEDLLNIFLPAYKKQISLGDLIKLNKFYTSPTGKKISQSQVEISKEVKTSAENYGKAIAEELIKKYQDIAAKKQEEAKKEEELKKAEEAKNLPETKKTEEMAKPKMEAKKSKTDKKK